MKHSLTTFLIVLICIPFSSSGQLLNKLKKAAQRGAERAVEKKIEEETEKAITRQINKQMTQLFGPSDSTSSEIDYGKMFSSMNMNVATADRYVFTGYTDMEISGTDEKGKPMEPVPFRSYSNTEAKYWGMEMQNTEEEEDLENVIMVFDQNNDAAIMLMENEKGEKSSFAYSMDWSTMMNEAMEEEAEDSTGELDISKTGNTKEILGYSCQEYTQDNEEISATYWISEDPIDGYFAYWNTDNAIFTEQLRKKYGAHFDELPKGSILEMTTTSKEDGSITHMLVTEINGSNQTEFIMSDYKSMTAGEK